MKRERKFPEITHFAAKHSIFESYQQKCIISMKRKHTFSEITHFAPEQTLYESLHFSFKSLIFNLISN